MKHKSLKHFLKGLISTDMYSLLRFKFPAYVTLISLYSLVFILLYKKNYQVVFTTLLVVVGITVALAQTCFQYISINKNKKHSKILLNVGEHFLAAAVWLSIATLIFFLSIRVRDLLVLKHWYLELLSIILDVLALLHFTHAVDSINKGIHRIGYVLFWKVDI